MGFKNEIKKEVFNMSYGELQKKLSEVDINLMKANVQINQKQNPYSKTKIIKGSKFNKNFYDVKKLRYIKSLVIMRLDSIARGVV